MITGHNTDVEYNGKVYHVQTEDKGLKNPVIESLIYVKGKILGSKKTSYADIVERGGGEKEILERLESQHKRMMLEVRSGKYAPGGPPPFGESLISKRSLDEVVLEYLAGLKGGSGNDRMEIMVPDPPALAFGARVALEIHVRTSLTSKPLAEIGVSVRLSHPAEGDTELFHGETGTSGTVQAEFEIPPYEEGDAVLIIEAVGERGQEQTRMMVHSAAPQPA
jgi:hypothetical protein